MLSTVDGAGWIKVRRDLCKQTRQNQWLHDSTMICSWILEENGAWMIWTDQDLRETAPQVLEEQGRHQEIAT